MPAPKSGAPPRRVVYRRRRSGFGNGPLLGVLVVLLVVVAVVAHHPQAARATRGPVQLLYAPITVDPVAIAEKTKQGQFAAVEAQIKSYEAAATKDWRAEMNLASAFSAFTLPDPAIPFKLRQWAADSPDSAIAHCARAIVLEQAAAVARGHEGGSTNTIAPDHFIDMEKDLNQAVQEADSARRLDPNLIIALLPAIDAAKMEADPVSLEDAQRRALAQTPASFQIRRAVIIAMEPRWGGSYEAMDKFANESQAYVAQNPMMRYLLGFSAMDQARELQADEKWDKSIPVLNHALEVGGDYASFYTYRGNAFFELRKYDDALADFKVANELMPDTPDNLELLALTLHSLNKPTDALEYSNRYLKLRESDRDIAQVHEWALAQVLKQ